MVSRKANSSSRGSVEGAAKADERSERGGSRGGAARAKRVRPPLDQAGLHDLALAYAARFATTGARLEAYLRRKLRERGSAEETESGRPVDIPALVSRMIELGYVDDEAYARMRSRDLSERGFGARRIEQALWAAGVGEDVRTDHAPAEAESRRAAVQFARKRRLGPFAVSLDEPGEECAERHKAREKAVAAMLRAGHDFAHARFVLEAAEITELEQWVAEAEESERGDTGGGNAW